MIFNINNASVVLLLGLAAWLVVVPAGAAPDGSGADARLEQVAGVLAYVGSDYAGAVNDHGHISSMTEYREQYALVEDAVNLAGQAGLAKDDAVTQGLAELRAQVKAKAKPSVVAALCKRIRAHLMSQHGLVLTPRTRPDRARARKLFFANGCNGCHGDDGSARTERARLLDPPPANFLDPGRMGGVSPYRAFHSITHGVPGTAMVGFSTLPEADRWSLAYWVLSLRYQSADADRGMRVLKRAANPVGTSADALASMSDNDLNAALGQRIPAPADREAALAYLRVQAPFRASGAGEALTLARKLLDQGVAAYRRGDRETARRSFIAAYLDGFEPQEAALRARDPALVDRVERMMMDLREQASRGAATSEVETRVTSIESLFDQAEHAELSGTTAFLGSAAIALREGFEAVLLLVALLALVRKRGNPKLARYVHAGWAVALPAGILTWYAFGEVLGGLGRELAEGIVGIAAAVVLLSVTHWILGQATARKWMGFVSKRLGAAASGRASAIGIFVFAFLAVYRELFEVVLFYKALLLDAAGQKHMVWMGVFAGLGGLALLALILRRIGQKLRPRPFMLASSVLLALLALVLLGGGVYSLQEAGVLASTHVELPEVPALGLHATTQGLAAQVVLLALLIASALWSWSAARRAVTTGGGPTRTAPSP